MSKVTVGENWRDLQDRLRAASEEECLRMIREELNGACRLRWIMRIRGRYRALRDEREENEIQQQWSEACARKAS